MKVPSLRRRLTLIIAASLIGLVAVTGAATTLVLRDQLEEDLNDRLSARIQLAHTLRADMPPENLAAQLSDRDIDVIIGSPVEGDEQHHGPHRGREVASTLADGTAVTFLADDHGIDQTIGTLLGVEAIVGAVTLVAVVLGASWLTRRSLAPVDQMVQAAEQIAAGSRGTRLRPERSDTELGRLATSFDGMVDSLEGSEAKMRQFVADASHELRTPTAGIQAAAEGFVEDDTPGPDRDQRLFDLVAGTHRLSRLVNDLLRLDRLDDPHLTTDYEPVNLAAVADQIVATATTVRSVTIERVGEPNAEVRGNAERLGRILSNLIDNAERHSPDGAVVRVDVRTEDGQVIAHVTDQGPGVPADQRERIFDRFTRLDSARASRDGGSGLGLAISRAIAIEHGGTLVCEARDEPGARFVLHIPALG
jgi:two-component system, OmpR family, sensor kinase